VLAVPAGAVGQAVAALPPKKAGEKCENLPNMLAFGLTKQTRFIIITL
jgi:hypothetical protein